MTSSNSVLEISSCTVIFYELLFNFLCSFVCVGEIWQVWKVGGTFYVYSRKSKLKIDDSISRNTFYLRIDSNQTRESSIFRSLINKNLSKSEYLKVGVQEYGYFRGFW